VLLQIYESFRKENGFGSGDGSDAPGVPDGSGGAGVVGVVPGAAGAVSVDGDAPDAGAGIPTPGPATDARPARRRSRKSADKSIKKNDGSDIDPQQTAG
jgi:hypothetical protein